MSRSTNVDLVLSQRCKLCTSINTTLGQRLNSLFPLHLSFVQFTHKTRAVDPVLGQCWAGVTDGGITLGQC